MVAARRNPDIHVGAGQSAVLRLNRAEQHFASAFNELLRVHDELNKVARVTAGVDDGVPTREPAGGQLAPVAEAV